MVADKGKKSKIEENPEEIDMQLLLSIEKLQEVQDELEKINDEASEKILEVEHKYDLVREPVYDKRSETIKSIPDFWLTAFLSHPALGELLTEDDQKVFKYLDSLEVRDFKDVQYGYSIIFNFQPNPYFEDEKLTKTFKFINNEGATKVTASPIKWKEGMQLPNGVDQEKKGNKRALSEESFFSWFYDVSAATEDFNDEIADIIKEELWVNPLSYFNNEADEEDGDEGKEDDDSDEDDDEQDDDDDEDMDGDRN